MKKIVGISIAVLSCSLSFSQGNPQIQNKNGVDIMPVKGEFAIGLNAAPILTYMGNIFGLTGSNNSLNTNKFLSNSFGGNTIYGKYMLSNDNALRASFRIADYNSVQRYDVYDDTKNSPDSTVVDTRQSDNNTINLGFGYEFRRGTTRLRGLYGGDVMLYRRHINNEYTYGNAFGMGNMTPTSAFNANGSYQGTNGNPVAERILMSKSGTTLGVGLRAFAGVEYFFAPKMCIGTEFGWTMLLSSTGKSMSSTEQFDPNATNEDGSTGGVVITNSEVSGSRNFELDTDNFNAALYFMFYF
ncbi:MAG: hypothetical protein R3279_08240 [Putridiphycobacter sp.]|nr:hypothetical protein [Putridiphycobacter sp.]